MICKTVILGEIGGEEGEFGWLAIYFWNKALNICRLLL